MEVVHWYSSLNDEHQIVVRDVDGSDILEVYFKNRECRTRHPHEPHDDIAKVFLALKRIYPQ